MAEQYMNKMLEFASDIWRQQQITADDMNNSIIQCTNRAYNDKAAAEEENKKLKVEVKELTKW